MTKMDDITRAYIDVLNNEQIEESKFVNSLLAGTALLVARIH